MEVIALEPQRILRLIVLWKIQRMGNGIWIDNKWRSLIAFAASKQYLVARKIFHVEIKDRF